MKYSTKLSDAVHVLCFISINPSQDLSSAAIAKSIYTNPGYVRQIMMSLKKAGLLSNTRGKANPIIVKPMEQITLLDVYRAVEQDKPLLHLDTQTNPECAAGVNIQLALQSFYDRVQEKAEEEMKSITLRDVISEYENRLHMGEFEFHV